MDIMEGQQKDARIAELERKLSAALGAVDFWQTAHEQAEAERDALLLAAYHEAGGFDSPKGFTNWVAGLRTTLAQPREDDH